MIKTPEQVEGIRRASRLTARILDMVAERIAAGVSTQQIDDWVREATEQAGARPATLGYRGYPKSCCTSINEVVCHGIPDPDRKLQEGDIVNVDVTSVLDGYFGDASRMFTIGPVAPEAAKLCADTLACLEAGIDCVRPGAHTGDIGQAIQVMAEAEGYGVVRDYCGHGCGLEFHEPPEVRHYGLAHTGDVLEPGMTFTIEPMINLGGHACKVLDDNWTVVTTDGSLSAQWEHTVLVTADGVEVLTRSEG